MAVGYVNQQRYPEFVKWLEDKQSISQSVYGSVEFVGTKENGEIIYDCGWKEKGRIPMEYVYSGYVFLTVKPSDNAARLIEINEHQEQEGEKGMTIEELCAKLDAFVARYDEENACKKQVETNEAKIVELNATIEQLQAAIDSNKKEVESKYEEVDALYKERDMLREELAKLKMAARIGEMNAALSAYSDEEKALVADDIAAFNADPMKVEINSVVQKLEAAAYRKMREKNIAETNARKDSFDVEDIFAAVDPVDPKENVIDFSDMLA
jgi:vacuolar-type H+-ATPase subunit I/STV1